MQLVWQSELEQPHLVALDTGNSGLFLLLLLMVNYGHQQPYLVAKDQIWSLTTKFSRWSLELAIINHIWPPITKFDHQQLDLAANKYI